MQWSRRLDATAADHVLTTARLLQEHLRAQLT